MKAFNTAVSFTVLPASRNDSVYLVVTQQVNRDCQTKFELQKALDSARTAYGLIQKCWRSQQYASERLRLSQSQSQASRQGKGKLLQDFLTQALHGTVCASASISTENRG